MSPEPVATLSGFLFLTLWPDEFAFAFFAAAAGTGIDDHHMEVGVQETEEPTNKLSCQPESQHTEPDVSKEELELLKRHIQGIHSSCGHGSNDTLVRTLRCEGAKTLILRLARDCVCPSCQEIQSQRPHPVASLEAILPKWQNIQIDQADWIHPTDSLEHKFSVYHF